MHEGLHPTLDADRLALFEQQKKFLFTHGFLDADFALDDWIDPRPLEAARAINARAIPLNSSERKKIMPNHPGLSPEAIAFVTKTEQDAPLSTR